MLVIGEFSHLLELHLPGFTVFEGFLLFNILELGIYVECSLLHWFEIGNFSLAPLNAREDGICHFLHFSVQCLYQLLRIVLQGLLHVGI